MTEAEKIQTDKTISIYKYSAGILLVILGVFLTAFMNDMDATRNDLKKKADVEYVDKKCQETKDELKTVLHSIEEQQKTANQDIKEILKSMPRK